MDHEFLDYKEVDVHFIYAFDWLPEQADPSRDSILFEEYDGGIFEKPLLVEPDVQRPQWINPMIHERLIDPPSYIEKKAFSGYAESEGNSERQRFFSTYQPSFSVNRRVLEYSNDLSSLGVDTYIYVPLEKHSHLLPENWRDAIQVVSELENGSNVVGLEKISSDNGIEFAYLDDEGEKRLYALVKVRLFWTVRLFDTRAGTVTMTVRVKRLQKYNNRVDRYKLLHWVMHLAGNVDRHAESHGLSIFGLEDNSEPTDSFLWLHGDIEKIKGNFPQYSEDVPFVTRLNDVANQVLKMSQTAMPNVRDMGDHFERVQSRKSAITLRFEERSQFLGKRESFVPVEEMGETSKYRYDRQRWDERQSPFILSSAIVSPQSMAEMKSCVSDMRTKEISSILLRQTIDNGKIQHDFTRLNIDYIQSYLPCVNGTQLRNVCLDERLFFTFSRRAALTVSAENASGPRYFVVPSFLNLLEILRAQLYSAIAINTALTCLSKSVMSRSAEQMLVFHKEYASLQNRFLMSRQNPLIHLFDGGSITEVAVEAMEKLMLNESYDQALLTFSLLESYMRSASKIDLYK